MSTVSIRRVEQADLRALLDIYNYYIVNTPITFDIEPRTLAQRQEWLDGFAATGRYQCFVAVKNGAPIGWSCSARFKEKAAYDTSIETSIYLAPGEERQGLGRRLYATLFEALAGEDIHRAYGGITIPNEASVGLHLAMGFRHIGSYTEVGRKFGKFWEVALYERPMPGGGE
ncbi:MAG TPA: GNAT family N-acetyltransferase [Rhizomicrobium sp.]